MTNKKIFIYYLSVFLFLILTICPLLISFCIKKDYVESRTLYVIDSWIEVKSYVKYDSNWKIISNENNRFFYIKAKDEKNKIFILNCQPRDFYFLVKKTSFVYCENKKIGIFEFYFIRNFYFRLSYICFLIVSFIWLIYLTFKLEKVFEFSFLFIIFVICVSLGGIIFLDITINLIFRLLLCCFYGMIFGISTMYFIWKKL